MKLPYMITGDDGIYHNLKIPNSIETTGSDRPRWMAGDVRMGQDTLKLDIIVNKS
ncbi:hypothetical protein [Acinetobacter sp. WZC-1]|uniref:hypothetical protein n=1 Tax=Acinetobacter sp. WZC-1 TaxID=3459034 RepID=UPI00403D6056